jgi:hypothetical protein
MLVSNRDSESLSVEAIVFSLIPMKLVLHMVEIEILLVYLSVCFFSFYNFPNFHMLNL